jgi:hypothetical protein
VVLARRWESLATKRASHCASAQETVSILLRFFSFVQFSPFAVPFEFVTGPFWGACGPTFSKARQRVIAPLLSLPRSGCRA